MRQHDDNDDVVMKELDTKEVLDGDNDDSGVRSEVDAPVSYDYEYLPDGWPGFLFDDRKPLSGKQRERIRNVEQAATNVHNVIQKYGNAPLLSLDPEDAGENGWNIDEGSAWADASSVVKEIVTAREELVRAWEAGDEGTSTSEGTKATPPKEDWWKPMLAEASTTTKGFAGCKEYEDEEDDGEEVTKEEEERFQQVHMEWATTAFAEELEALRMGQLDVLTSARKQKKGAARHATRDDATAFGLDPTRHSFVLASGDRGGGGADKEREETADIDVQVLADMVRSGSHFLSRTEKAMLLGARQRGAAAPGGASEGEGGISLHERRRRQLGFVDGRGAVLNPFSS